MIRHADEMTQKEMQKMKERIAELEAAVCVQSDVIGEFTSGKGDMTDDQYSRMYALRDVISSCAGGHK